MNRENADKKKIIALLVWQSHEAARASLDQARHHAKDDRSTEADGVGWKNQSSALAATKIHCRARETDGAKTRIQGRAAEKNER
jgi:hypothetical protein